MCSYDQQYYVLPGDTFYHLSQRYGIPLIGIQKANPDVDPENLIVGQIVCLPLPQCENGFQYIIKPYDTLYRIAQLYNVTVEDILNRNPGIQPYNLQLGQTICIPPSIEIDCQMNRYYIIKPGDTLYELAKQFNVPLKSLLSFNSHIKNPNQLTVGTKICVPSPMITPDVEGE